MGAGLDNAGADESGAALIDISPVPLMVCATFSSCPSSALSPVTADGNDWGSLPITGE